MKKIISVLLISFFTFSAFEIYAMPKTAPKSCCCPSAKMCKCKHAGGACPLTFREGSDKDSKDLLIKLAGCGAGNSPVVAPHLEKNLYLDLRVSESFRLFSGFLVESNPDLYEFLVDFPRDKPPKVISL